jgi:hypothetical protein
MHIQVVTIVHRRRCIACGRPGHQFTNSIRHLLIEARLRRLGGEQVLPVLLQMPKDDLCIRWCYQRTKKHIGQHLPLDLHGIIGLRQNLT